MRRPPRTTIDPAALEEGEIARQTGVEDAPFDPDDPEAFARVMHHLTVRLPEPDRSCVQMCVMGRIPYREAAELLEQELGYVADPKTVWRWAQRGLGQLRDWLEGTSWIGVLLAGRIPFDEPGTGPQGPDDTADIGNEE